MSSAISCLADVKMASLFTDNMVLQRGMPLPVWGSAAPSESVTVRFRGQVKTAQAGSDGKWMVKLDETPASSEPSEMRIEGKNEIVLKNVLVGEVWICGGQSNMHFTLANIEAKEAIANSKIPQIRLYTVNRQSSNELQSFVAPSDNGQFNRWLESDPGSSSDFSAIALLS